MSKRARADVVAACEWWKRNLPGAHIPLVNELRRAQQQLATTPWAGVSVSDDVLSTLRRLSLVRARYFLFYEVDESLGEVRVLRVWHMSRGETPQL
jgi:plasmid stabilization system protein ParE